MDEELLKKLDEIILPFGNKFSIDLKASLEKSLKDSGSKNVEESAVTFQPKYDLSNGNISIKILTNQDYWKYIEFGRKPGKMPPPNKLGKEWQVSQKIDARRVIAEINIKSNPKGKPKRLSFDAAAKQLSFLIARSIGKKGLKPRPYIDRVLNDGRIDKLKKDIADIFKKEITIELIKPEGIKQTE